MNRGPGGFTLRGCLDGFRWAFRGIGVMLRTQRNARIHALATAGVACAGAWFRVSPPEWAALLLACTAVWVAEGFNTALELLADAAVPEFHEGIGRAKDVAAGAVLLAAIGAAATGLAVFVPRALAR